MGILSLLISTSERGGGVGATESLYQPTSHSFGGGLRPGGNA